MLMFCIVFVHPKALPVNVDEFCVLATSILFGIAIAMNKFMRISRDEKHN